MTNKFLLALSAALLAACASTQGGSTTTASASADAPVFPKSSPNRITAEEVMRANVPTAYEAVDRLHRQWFRSLQGEASGSPAVYVNNQKQDEGLEALKQIPSAEISSIDY